MATLQMAALLCDAPLFSETRLLLETADSQRHPLALPAGRYETMQELLAALSERMAETLPNGEARLNETNKVVLMSSTPFRPARLAGEEEAARYGALSTLLGFAPGATRAFDYLVAGENTPGTLLSLLSIAKLEPKAQAASGSQAQGRAGALRTRAFGAWMTYDLVLDFIPEREWPKLSLLLAAFAKGEPWTLDDGRGACRRLRSAGNDSEPVVARPYAQAPYLRVSLTVKKEEP